MDLLGITNVFMNGFCYIFQATSSPSILPLFLPWGCSAVVMSLRQNIDYTVSISAYEEVWVQFFADQRSKDVYKCLDPIIKDVLLFWGLFQIQTDSVEHILSTILSQDTLVQRPTCSLIRICTNYNESVHVQVSRLESAKCKGK